MHGLLQVSELCEEYSTIYVHEAKRKRAYSLPFNLRQASQLELYYSRAFNEQLSDYYYYSSIQEYFHA